MARKNKVIDEIAKHIGAKICSLRLAQGLSIQQLADAIGVTHQQLRKYEKGRNGTSAGRLMLIARTLSKDISYFYEGFGSTKTEIITTKRQRICVEVSRNFMKIESPKCQDAINTLIKTLTKAA